MTALLEATGLVVERGGREACRADHLAIGEGETLAVLGPNGAGKTSLVLALASLLPARGTLCYRGAPIADLLAYRRRIAVAFQRPLLLDRSAGDNAGLGLEIRGVPAPERRRRAAAALERFGIGHLAGRQAAGLSGGEAQRVSLARAFAIEPELLFLDEPFSALDAPTREGVVVDLARALRGTTMTTVLVTHDRDEALALADRVAVVLEGRVRQVDRTDSVFAMPADTEVAAFVGVENVLPSRVERAGEEVTLVRVGVHAVEVAEAPPAGDDEPLLLIGPDEIVLSGAAAASSARNALPGRIAAVEHIGRRVRVVVDCGFPLVVHVTRQSAREMQLAPGDQVVASFKATSAHLLSRRRS